MRIKTILFSIFLISVCQFVTGQLTNSEWTKWNHLIGEWVGEGNGEPGKGNGSFSFKTDLNGKIIMRKNHTVFPESEKSKELIHDDLLIVYHQAEGAPEEALYLDNEGNTIKYMVSYAEKAIILTSEKSADKPRFRLSYETIDAKTVIVKFEMASPQAPDQFRIYLAGKAFKKE
jgi:hypothetical protein